MCYTIKGKAIIAKMWDKNVLWDEPVSDEIMKEYSEFVRLAERLNQTNS